MVTFTFSELPKSIPDGPFPTIKPLAPVPVMFKVPGTNGIPAMNVFCQLLPALALV